MATKTVRLLEEDIALVNRLCGVDASLPFAAKAHAVLRGLQTRQEQTDRIRLALRQELARIAGAD
jgi:hypothetical protein